MLSYFYLYLEKFFLFQKYDIYLLISFVLLFFLTLIYFSKLEDSKKIRIYKFFLILSILIFILFSIYLSQYQYSIWKNHPISKYLVSQKGYFIGYVFYHFWLDFILRLVAIGIVFVILIFLEFVFKREIFYDDEKILIPLLTLFFIFPFNMFFLFLGFFMLLLLIGSGLMFKKTNLKERYSFKNYWIYLAWLIFIFQPLILNNYKFLQYKP